MLKSEKSELFNVRWFCSQVIGAVFTRVVSLARGAHA